jgi:hypothetical protein
MLCLLYSPKQKIVKFHAQKQIGKSHVIDIFTSEDMENISLYFSVSHPLLYNKTVYQYGKMFYIFYNIAQRNIKKEIFRVDRLSYVNTALSQSAFRIYKCYIIIMNVLMSKSVKISGHIPWNSII